MRGCALAAGAGNGGPAAFAIASVAPENVLGRAVAADKKDLTVTAVKRLVGKAQKRFLIQIQMKCFLIPDRFSLKGELAAQTDRADRDLFIFSGVGGLGKTALLS